MPRPVGNPTSAVLADREDTYYRQWMGLGGETRSKRWSKRRAMFWGLLVAKDHDTAYQRGRAIGAAIGQAPTIPNGADLDLTWFFGKAVVAELFTINRTGQAYRLEPRPTDPWAPLLADLAMCLHAGKLRRDLPVTLPPRVALLPTGNARLLGLAKQAFGAQSLLAIEDLLETDDVDAREFRLALTRGDTTAAHYWFQHEWSSRRKETFRSGIESEQANACGCCGRTDVGLQLNHRTKVRDWGRTSATNLEALCPACHRHVDRFGTRCHGAK